MRFLIGLGKGKVKHCTCKSHGMHQLEFLKHATNSYHVSFVNFYLLLLSNYSTDEDQVPPYEICGTIIYLLPICRTFNSN